MERRNIFVVLNLLIAVSAQRFTPNSCPDRPVVQNFDIVKYTAPEKWYEILRYDAKFEKGCNCGYAKYTLNPDNTVAVNNCCTRNDFSCSLGSATLSEPDHVPLEGKLNVAFGNQPNDVSNYWILSTDYVNYSVVYFCKNIGANQSIELAWLLSTKPQVDASVKNITDTLIDQYFDRSGFIVPNQSAEFCTKDED